METRDGVFRATLSIAGKPIFVGNKKLDPQTFKIDVDIQSATVNGTTVYEFNNSNSNWALYAVVASKAVKRVVDGSAFNASASLELSDNSTHGSFTWDTQLNGTDVHGKSSVFTVEHTYEDTYTDTNVTLDAGYSLSRIFFAFDALTPTRINWDPETNIDSNTGSSTGQSSTGSSQTGSPTGSQTGTQTGTQTGSQTGSMSGSTTAEKTMNGAERLGALGFFATALLVCIMFL